VEPVFCFWDYATYSIDGSVKMGPWGASLNGCLSQRVTRTGIPVHVAQFGPFVAPSDGGGWSGTIQNGQLLYNGAFYLIVNGRVNFPDCTTYIVAPNGALIGGSPTPNCSTGGETSPTATVSPGVTPPGGGGFTGPGNGGGWSGTIQNGQLLYGGTLYPIVNAVVTFPDCSTYIVAPNGLLFRGAPPAIGCTPSL
jgi:hypothetical protein